MNSERYDIIVIGGGHAGVESAFAAQKFGLSVALITHRADTISRMSCNPSVGGMAKSRVVREVDALGGIIGTAADESAIQYRVLNRRKGPAVQATRCQNDRWGYEKFVQSSIEACNGIDIIQDSVKQLHIAGDSYCTVRLSNSNEFSASTVILATGTFLGGKIFIGHDATPGGRIYEAPEEGLSKSLREAGIKLLRFKTGTPPRIDKNTVDFDNVQRQPGENNYIPFSFDTTTKLPLEIQKECYITFTTERTHSLILQNLDKSALYGGKITGTGPRYCPSIEVKVKRFPHHPRHIVFLEPEGIESNELYPNGISNSLPREIQLQMLQTIPGLEHVDITQPAYAVEYDIVDSLQVDSTLHLRKYPRIFLAGQILGTSGYEEAAGLGLLAGTNAALTCLGENCITLPRHKSYIGVMVDDLVHRGADEPYRLLTGRAEFRLLLREDNAWLSMLETFPPDVFRTLAPERYSMFKRWAEEIANARIFVSKRVFGSAEADTLGISAGTRMENYLKRHDANWTKLNKILPELDALSPAAHRTFRIEMKYSGYIERQFAQIAQIERIESMRLPEDIDYETIGLRLEAREKFIKFRPKTIGEAAAIPGISPSDVAILAGYIRRTGKGK